MKKQLSFTVIEQPDNSWTVRSGDRFQHQLCKDEVLYILARLLVGNTGAEGVLRTAEEHDRATRQLYRPLMEGTSR